MHDTAMALFFLALGLSVYLRARRDGSWSWPMFWKALLGAAAILALVLPLTYYLVTSPGGVPPWLTTATIVALIAILVTLLALLLRPRR